MVRTLLDLFMATSNRFLCPSKLACKLLVSLLPTEFEMSAYMS